MSDDSERIFGANVRASGLSVSRGHEATGNSLRALALTRLDVDDIEGHIGELAYRADKLSLDGVQTILGRDRITAEAADVVGLQLQSPDAQIQVRRVSCPRGLLSAGTHELFAPHVSFEDVTVVIEDLSALLGRKSDGGPVDWHFLDVLQGQLDIDLAVDMTLPWLGRRRVTHYFRVPIENGTIDYKKLEDDVHWLEAAFLTLELVDEQLVLARDLPLVPFSGKALLCWPLEPADVPVAGFQRVHLRNLMRPQVPLSRREKRRARCAEEAGQVPSGDSAERAVDKGKSKPKLTLHALAMQNFKLELHIGNPVQVALPMGAMLQFGDDESTALSGLQLTGEIRYDRDAPASAATATCLSGSADLVDVTLNEVRVGESALSIDRLHIGGIDQIILWFQGFRPTRVELSIGRMAATNVRVRTE